MKIAEKEGNLPNFDINVLKRFFANHQNCYPPHTKLACIHPPLKVSCVMRVELLVIKTEAFFFY